MPEDFHFLNPGWLLALIPLGTLLWALRRRGAEQSAWRGVVDANLLPHLLSQGPGRAHWLPLALLSAGWIIAVLALANPTFERLPTPAHRGTDSRVVVLDLSRSMATGDLEPSRLARARFKVADILERSRDGQVGLVAFAGDAFIVAPLTDDADTILSMLDALTPEIMPVQGSRPDLALIKASELLGQAGALRGEVVLVGDDAGDERALQAAKTLAQAGHQLSVIGVGTGDGGPVPEVRDPEGRPVLAVLDEAALSDLARVGGGDYAPLSSGGKDLERVLRAPGAWIEDAAEVSGMQIESWRELGPGIALALLPLGALAFRRGWSLGLALMVVGHGVLVPEPAMAGLWADLWQRRDQQAAAALERGDHEQALSLAEHPQRRGTASYRVGDYEAAARSFANLDSPEAHYNQGNALAKGGRLEEAVAAYDRALLRQPGMEDALHNKALVEDLLRRRQEQQQQPPRDNRPDGQHEGQQDGPQSADQHGDGEGEERPGDRRQEGEQQSAERSQQNGDGPGQEGHETGGERQGREDVKPGRDQGGMPGQTPTGEQRESSESAGQDQEQGRERTGRSGAPEGEPDAGGSGSAAQAGEASSESGAADPRRGQSTGGRVEGPPGDELGSEGDDREAAEQAAADYRREAARHAEEESEGRVQEPIRVTDDLTAEQREARQAADQWLRRIPDDPAGLLRRKLLYQYRRRVGQGGAVTSGNPW